MNITSYLIFNGQAEEADPRTFGNGHMLTLACDSVTQTEEVYARLCVGAQKIQCELAEAFFAKRYAEVVDRYGILRALIYEEK